MIDWRDTLEDDNDILKEVFNTLQKLENIKDENLLTDFYTCYALASGEAVEINEFIFNLGDLIAVNVDKLRGSKNELT